MRWNDNGTGNCWSSKVVEKDKFVFIFSPNGQTSGYFKIHISMKFVYILEVTSDTAIIHKEQCI